MVRVPEGGGGIAALRYVLARINGSGQLHQARLRGDEIHLEFREKLSSLHPQKLVETLRRMPTAADTHDDWMIDQFGVQPLDRGHIDPLDDAELGRAEEIWRVHWGEVDELLKEAQRKRSLWFLNELTAYAIHRVRFALPLAGKLLPRLLESAGTFNDTDVDPRKRETTLGKFSKEMKSLHGDELRGNLGHLTYAISPHSEGTPQKLAEYFGECDYMDSIAKHRKSGSSIDAALPLVGTYYYLLAVHAWPPEVSEELKNGLAESSEKPWRETAAFLFEHARGMVDQFCEEEDDEDGESSDSEEEQ
jgi:hypothetical protein